MGHTSRSLPEVNLPITAHVLPMDACATTIASTRQKSPMNTTFFCETNPFFRTGAIANAVPPKKTNPNEPTLAGTNGCPILCECKGRRSRRIGAGVTMTERNLVGVVWVIHPPMYPSRERKRPVLRTGGPFFANAKVAEPDSSGVWDSNAVYDDR